MAADMIGKADRSVRQWRTDMLNNDGVLLESKQGKYQRTGVLWNNEELNEKARQYVRINSSVKGSFISLSLSLSLSSLSLFSLSSLSLSFSLSLSHTHTHLYMHAQVCHHSFSLTHTIHSHATIDI